MFGSSFLLFPGLFVPSLSAPSWSLLVSFRTSSLILRPKNDVCVSACVVLSLLLRSYPGSVSDSGLSLVFGVSSVLHLSAGCVLRWLKTSVLDGVSFISMFAVVVSAVCPAVTVSVSVVVSEGGDGMTDSSDGSPSSCLVTWFTLIFPGGVLLLLLVSVPPVTSPAVLAGAIVTSAALSAGFKLIPSVLSCAYISNNNAISLKHLHFELSPWKIKFSFKTLVVAGGPSSSFMGIFTVSQPVSVFGMMFFRRVSICSRSTPLSSALCVRPARRMCANLPRSLFSTGFVCDRPVSLPPPGRLNSACFAIIFALKSSLSPTRAALIVHFSLFMDAALCLGTSERCLLTTNPSSSYEGFKERCLWTLPCHLSKLKGSFLLMILTARLWVWNWDASEVFTERRRAAFQDLCPACMPIALRVLSFRLICAACLLIFSADLVSPLWKQQEIITAAAAQHLSVSIFCLWTIVAGAQLLDVSSEKAWMLWPEAAGWWRSDHTDPSSGRSFITFKPIRPVLPPASVGLISLRTRSAGRTSDFSRNAGILFPSSWNLRTWREGEIERISKF